MNKSKLFTTLTLAAFVGVTACETQDDTQFDDTTTDPAVEQPATTPGTDTWEDGDTWDDDATFNDTTMDDTLRQQDDWDEDGADTF